MLSGQALKVTDLFLIGLSGMAVVMLELALIAIMIYLMARITKRFAGPKNLEEQKRKGEKTAIDDNDANDELNAVIMSVISEDLGVPLDELEFSGIREI